MSRHGQPRERRGVAAALRGRGRHAGPLTPASWVAVALGGLGLLVTTLSWWAAGRQAEAATVHVCDAAADFACLQNSSSTLVRLDAGGSDTFSYTYLALVNQPKTLQVLAQFPADADATAPTLTVRLRNVLRLDDVPGFVEDSQDHWTYTGDGLDGTPLEGVVVGGSYTPDVETLTYGTGSGTGTGASTTEPSGTLVYQFATGTTSASIGLKLSPTLAFGLGVGTVDSANVPSWSTHAGDPLSVWTSYTAGDGSTVTVDSADVERVSVTSTPGYYITPRSSSTTLTALSGPVTQSVVLARADSTGATVGLDDAAVLDRTYWLEVACTYSDWAVTSTGGYKITPVGSCRSDGWQYLKVQQQVRQAPAAITVTFTFNVGKASGSDHPLTPAVGALNTVGDGTGGMTSTGLDGSVETTALTSWGSQPTLTVGGYAAPAFTVVPLAQGNNEVYPADRRNWLDAIYLQNTGSATSGPLTMTLTNTSPGTVGATSVTIVHPAAVADARCGGSPCGLVAVTASTSDASGNPSGQRSVDYLPTTAGATWTTVTVTGLGGTSAQYLTSLTFTWAQPWPTAGSVNTPSYLDQGSVLVQGTPLRAAADYASGIPYAFTYTLFHRYNALDNAPMRVNQTLQCAATPTDTAHSCTVTSSHTLLPDQHYEFQNWTQTAATLTGMPDYLNAGDTVSGVTLAFSGLTYWNAAPKFASGVFSAYLFENGDLTIDPSSVSVSYNGTTSRATDPGGPFSLTKKTYVEDGTTFTYYVVASRTSIDCRVSSSTVLVTPACPTVTWGFQVATTVATTVLPPSDFVAFGFDTDTRECAGNECVDDVHDVAGAATLDSPTLNAAAYNFRAALDLAAGLSASVDAGQTYGSSYDAATKTGTTVIDGAAIAAGSVTLRVQLHNVSGASSGGVTHVWIPIPKIGETSPYHGDYGGCAASYTVTTPEGAFNTGCDLQAGAFGFSLALTGPVQVNDADLDPSAVTVSYGSTNSSPDAAGSRYAWANLASGTADYHPWAQVADASQVRMVHVAIAAPVAADGVVSIVLPVSVAHTSAELLALAGRTDLFAARVYRSVPTFTGYATTAPVRLELKTGQVSGRVFYDTDRNGVRGATDQPWAGAVVQVLRHGVAVADPVTTADDGTWSVYLDSLAAVDVRFTLLITADPSGEPTTPSARFWPSPGVGVGVSSPTPASDQSSATTTGVYPSLARGASTGSGTSAYQFDDVDAAVIRPTMITLNPSGGRFTTDSSTRNRVRYQFVGGVVGSAADAVSRYGYTLAGWATSASAAASAALDLTTVAVPTVTTTYYATWTPVAAALTLDANGGTVSGWGATSTDAVQTRPVAYDSTVTLPTPTGVDGSIFVAWCTSRSATGVLDGCTTYKPGSMAYTQASITDRTLYAKWRVGSFAVTFDLAGGSYAGSTTAPAGFTASYGQTASAAGATWPSDPSLTPPVHTADPATPYVFAGWYSGLAGQPAQRVTATTALTWTNLGGSGTVTAGTVTDWRLTLTARWVLRGHLSIDPAGGTLADSSTLATSSLPAEGSTVTLGTRSVAVTTAGVTATATVQRLGYRFGGWTDVSAATAVAPGTVTWTGDLALFGWRLAATWAPLVGTLHLHDAGAATGATDVDVVGGVTFDAAPCAGLTGASCPGALPTPTRTGQVFLGWWTAATGDATQYLPGVTTYSSTTGLTADSTALPGLDLYARWRPVQVVLDFDARGGSAVTWSETVSLGSAPTLAGATTTRTGYDFAGWWLTAADGSSADGSAADVEVTASTPWTTLLPDGAVVTLVARWTPRTYTLTLDPLGGVPADADDATPQARTVTFGAAFGPLPTATRTGYTLTAWRSTWDPTSGVTGGRSYPVGSMAGYDVAGDLTLYAQWTPLRTLLTLDAGAGTVGGQPQLQVTADYGEQLTGLPDATREGYDFAGWFTDQGSRLTAGTVWTGLTPTLTVHARWRMQVLGVQVVDGTSRSPAPAAEQVTLSVTRSADTSCAGGSSVDVICVDYGATVAGSGAGATVSVPAGWLDESWGTLHEGLWTAFDQATTAVRTDLTIMPGWALAPYRVTLAVGSGDVPGSGELAGGTNPWRTPGGGTSTVLYTARLVDALPAGSLTPTATGFTFTGWTCTSGPCTGPLDTTTTMPAGDVTWTATWVRQTYRVVYHLALPDGVAPARVSTGAPTGSDTVAYGRTLPLPAHYVAPVVAGLDFDGWSTRRGLGLVTPGVSPAPAGVGGVLDLYATWSTAQLRVRFDLQEFADVAHGPVGVTTADGGSYTVTDALTQYGATLAAAQRPVDPLAAPYSHVFLGWSRDQVATGPDDFYRFGGDDPVTGDTVLYAQWERRSFVVAFDTNPGDGQDGRPKHVDLPDGGLPTRTVAYGAAVPTVSVPHADGFVLVGWNTAADGSGRSYALGDHGTRVTGPVTLYAQWMNLWEAVALGAGGLLALAVVGVAGWVALRRRRAPMVGRRVRTWRRAG